MHPTCQGETRQMVVVASMVACRHPPLYLMMTRRYGHLVAPSGLLTPVDLQLPIAMLHQRRTIECFSLSSESGRDTTNKTKYIYYLYIKNKNLHPNNVIIYLKYCILCQSLRVIESVLEKVPKVTKRRSGVKLEKNLLIFKFYFLKHLRRFGIFGPLENALTI